MERKFTKRFVVTGVILLLFLGTGWFALTRVARDLVFQPPALVAEPDFASPAPERVAVQTADGLVLHGYYWRGARDLVVVFHGNAETQQEMAAAAGRLRASSHGVLIASYRGYGGNPGKPSETGLFADGDAWMKLAWMLQPRGRHYVYGHSLGAAVAIEMAARFPVDGIATLGAFARLRDLAPDWGKPFLLDRFDNLTTSRRVMAPFFLFHGTKDPVVPYVDAARIARATGGRAKVITLNGAGHAVPLTVLAPMLWQALELGRIGPEH